MKRLRLDQWASQLQPPRNPRLCLQQPKCPFPHETRSTARSELQQRRYQTQTQWKDQRRVAVSRRGAASASTQVRDPDTAMAAAAGISRPADPSSLDGDISITSPRIALRSPSYKRARYSAKLSALHARLSLPSRLPLETLARCLVDSSVDSRPGYNNAPFAVLGMDLLGLYTSEYLMCHYPRLPMSVLFSAQSAYVGPATLAAMRSEWGVEVAAAPGSEVDPGLLQLQKVIPGNSLAADGMHRVKDMPQTQKTGSGRPDEQWHHRRGISSRTVYDDQFGELQTGVPTSADMAANHTSKLPDQSDAAVDFASPPSSERPSSDGSVSVTVEEASATFVRALTGALYLHAGADASKAFHKAHVLSRQLALHTLFNFTHPTRDLSRLCAREGFEPPVARLISETGRVSRSPVFVVGVFSGSDKLGEGAGSSLNEARIRAAGAALRSWYLYSPPDTEIVLPSEVEGPGSEKKAWKPQMIDVGEVVT